MPVEIPAHLLPRDGHFGCGPAKIRGEALEALATRGRSLMGTSHRQPPVRRLVRRIQAGLAALHDLPEGYEVVLGNGGSTLFWDAASFCLVERQASVGVFGEFGSKFSSVLARAPWLAPPVVTEVAPGSATLPLPAADADDRHIELTPGGRAKATSVMRKHRLAEVLLTEVIGLPLELVHAEACRWEHVISDAVEARLVVILDAPTRSPYGNPIPPAGALGPELPRAARVRPLADALRDGLPADVVVERLTEVIQADADLIALLRDAGVRPGTPVIAQLTGDRLLLTASGGTHAVERDVAQHLFVRDA